MRIVTLPEGLLGALCAHGWEPPLNQVLASPPDFLSAGSRPVRAPRVWSPPLIMRNTSNVILAGLTHAHFLLCGVLCVVVFLIFFFGRRQIPFPYS